MVLIAGKDVKPLQSSQAFVKFVPKFVVIAGNDVNDEHLCHAAIKLVPKTVLTEENEVKALQSLDVRLLGCL